MGRKETLKESISNLLHLAKERKLKTLDLSSSGANDEDVKEIIEILGRSGTGLRINLSGNLFSDMTILLLSDLIKEGRILALDLSDNAITFNGFSVLAESLKYDNSLMELRMNKTTSDFLSEGKALLVSAILAHQRLHTVQFGPLTALAFEQIIQGILSTKLQRIEIEEG